MAEYYWYGINSEQFENLVQALLEVECGNIKPVREKGGEQFEEIHGNCSRP
ncbi:MAG: hypothetical protein ACFFD4_33995 [Candidatus Odinarchaeota archaeon]